MIDFFCICLAASNFWDDKYSALKPGLHIVCNDRKHRYKYVPSSIQAVLIYVNTLITTL